MLKFIQILAMFIGIIASFAAGWHMHHVIVPVERSITSPAQLPPEERMIPGIIGFIDAPVSLRAFVSFSSPEAARFALGVLPSLRRPIAEGLLQVIIHDTPEDRNALHAAILARCASASTYPKVVEGIFRTQNQWTTSEDPALELAHTALESGLSEDRIIGCLSTTNSIRLVGSMRDDAYDKYHIKSAPAFLLSSPKGTFWMEGVPSVREFENAIRRMTPDKQD